MPRKASKPTKRAPKVALSHLDESEVSESEGDSVSDYQASSNSEDERCSTPESQKDSKCGVCRRTVNSSDKSLQCDTCSEWCHIKVCLNRVSWRWCWSVRPSVRRWLAGWPGGCQTKPLVPLAASRCCIPSQPAGFQACYVWFHSQKCNPFCNRAALIANTISLCICKTQQFCRENQATFLAKA